MYKGADEAALVDGTVIGANGSDRQAFISIGDKQKVVLGMTFSVYSDKTQIRPDADGNYPRGKATLEVINVGESSSTCRITSEARGNPVVKGDVIANPIYDPNKTYKFVVFGNFDANRDGTATALERREINAMIESWGGKVVDDLTGDVDFLVLGERPILPPRPSAESPFGNRAGVHPAPARRGAVRPARRTGHRDQHPDPDGKPAVHPGGQDAFPDGPLIASPKFSKKPGLWPGFYSSRPSECTHQHPQPPPRPQRPSRTRRIRLSTARRGSARKSRRGSPSRRAGRCAER